MPSRAVNAIRGGLEAVERLSGHARGSSAASRSQRRQAHADRVKPPRARGEETVEQVAPWQARSGEGVVSDGPSRMRTPGEPGAGRTREGDMCSSELRRAEALAAMQLGRSHRRRNTISVLGKQLPRACPCTVRAGPG